MPSAAAAYLSANECEWCDLFDRLSERFPKVAPERIAQALRNNAGHAGSAAAELRDLTSVIVKPPDPDDAEHVATLLSSPVMFKHACKEQFVKFDTNGDGVLDFPEIMQLTNALYFSFGLQQPPQGALEAFFKLTDENRDGVLTEREFRKFFEMFLRYAFFDVVKLQQIVNIHTSRSQNTPTHAGEDGSSSCAASAPPKAFRADEAYGSEVKSPTRRREAVQQSRETQPARSTRREDDRRAKPALSSLVCVAPQGLHCRAYPDHAERPSEHFIAKGDVAEALEFWVRTPHGWLPVHDQSGNPVLEKLPSKIRASRQDADSNRAAPAVGEPRHEYRQEPRAEPRQDPPRAEARPRNNGYVDETVAQCASPQRYRSTSNAGPSGESGSKVPVTTAPPKAPNSLSSPSARPVVAESVPEEWRPLFDRLTERFPDAGSAKILKALRDTGGHAGKAAAQLRA